jgi:hypothetical protein
MKPCQPPARLNGKDEVALRRQPLTRLFFRRRFLHLGNHLAAGGPEFAKVFSHGAKPKVQGRKSNVESPKPKNLSRAQLAGRNLFSS